MTFTPVLKKLGYYCEKTESNPGMGYGNIEYFCVYDSKGNRITPTISTPQTAKYAWSEAADYIVWNEKGEPNSNIRCPICGDILGWGSHPNCAW
jgi:hypothetical protein